MTSPLYIIWTEENEIGVPIIDEQHRSIVATINTLHYYIMKESGERIVKNILIMLEDYTKVHFKTEEELMRRAKYPDWERHFDFHVALSNKTKHIHHNIREEKDADTVLLFLKEWWINHINHEDRRYVPYVIDFA